MALFDRAATAEYLGALVVLDTAGNIIADSTSITPHSYNLGDRDYFRVHQDRSDVGLFISRPIQSRLRGDKIIAISRRIASPDGRFGGVAVGTMRLAYFRNLFARLELGSNGSVVLMRADGRVIMRRPFRESDIDRDLSEAPAYASYTRSNAGHIVATALIDGIERLYTFRHVTDLPLIVAVGAAVEDIYAPWWRKAISIGLALTALCATTVALSLLTRKEIRRRLAAEKALLQAASSLSVMASTDSLTGLANRRTFAVAIADEWLRAVRDTTSIALLMLDADYFKRFNDRYGHPEGDVVLKRLAACIQQNSLRPADIAARYGGEEFVLLLPDTEIAGALVVAEKIRSAVADLAIRHDESPYGVMTISIGVVAARPIQRDPESQLVERADAALYQAKRAGRNRVCVACEGPDATTLQVLPTALPAVMGEPDVRSESQH